MEYKVLCCDIDGTLVRDDKSLSSENIKWIKRLVDEKGVKFVLVSGRLLSAMIAFNQQIGVKGAVSCYNGCSFYNEDYSLITENRLDNKYTSRILKEAKKFNIELIFFDNEKWCIEENEKYAYNQKVKLYMCPPEIVDFSSFIKSRKTNKIIAMSKDQKNLELFQNQLRKVGIDESVITFYRASEFLEIMPKGFNKGTAIDDIANYYNFDKSQIMAIGDDYNDIEMLEKAGYSIGMKNSVPEVLNIVDYVTDSNMEDGVAKAIQKFFF